MFSWRKGVLLSRRLGLTSGCLFMFAVAVAVAGDGVPPRIPVVNVEDIAPLDGGRWVIGSSMAGGTRSFGEIVAVEVASGRSTGLYHGGRQDGHGRFAGCPGEVEPGAFKPHGLAVRTFQGGGSRLYVVNHGGRESIEMFDLSMSPGSAPPKLTWIGCVPFPPGGFGNAVAPTASGGFYATNMGRPMSGGDPVTPMGGDVLSWDERGGWRTVPDSAMPAPNGLIASSDGGRLYVASWTGGDIVELSPGKPAAKRSLHLDFLPDNLRWGRDGAILVGGQQTAVQTVVTCYTSRQDRCDVPSAIARIDAASMHLTCSRPVDIGMATVVAPVGDELWVSSTRGDSILRLRKDVFDTPGCK